MVEQKRNKESKMDLQKLRAIAGLPSVRQTTQKPSHDPVLESGDARFIVSYLRKKFADYANVNVKVYEAIKEHLQTEAGVANASVLNGAMALIAPKVAFEQRNSLRKMAGLPPLSEEINEDEDEDETDSEEEEVEELDSEDKKEVEDAEQDDAEEDDVDADESENEEKDDAPDTDTNDVSELVATIANKLLKDGAPEESELADFLMKVYQAGAADAVSKSAS